MADEILRSKHAFGALANLDNAIAEGKIDAYDILFLSDGDEHRIGWLDKNGNKVILEDKKQVIIVEVLPESGESDVIYICGSTFYFWDGAEFVPATDNVGVSEEFVSDRVNDALENANAYTDEEIKTSVTDVKAYADSKYADANAYTDAEIETSLEAYLAKRYEVTSKPDGTLVNYRDKEIRVMCPADTKWEKQNVGPTGNANMYYMGFKAYAPDNAVSFKEDDLATIEDQTMYYFEDNSFAGVDELGRKYSITWLPLASYDEATDTWNYFGAVSTKEQYIGWYYSVEWYDENGIIIASDCIRVNLSNEDCHSSIEPYYVASIGNVDAKIDEATKNANEYTDEKIAEAMSGFEIIEF